MGKSKPKRTTKNLRDNPTGVAVGDVDEVTAICSTLGMSGNPGKLSPEAFKALSKQLQSGSAEDRDCACNAIAKLVRNSDDSCAALHEGLIKVLGPLLLDVSTSVCHSAASALSTIILNGGDDAVKLATNHDILTPLIALLKRIPDEWKPHEECGEKIDTATATFLEVVGTLSLLCEASDLAVDRVHQEDVVKLIIKYLDTGKYGSDVATAAAQFLTTVTEDQGNSDYLDNLKKEVSAKLSTMGDDEPLLKTLHLMILFNLNHQTFNTDLGLSANAVLGIMNSSLSLDQRKAASLVVDFLPVSKDEEEEMGEAMEDGLSKGAKLKQSLENTEQVLSSQIKSLEILTNICCACDDPDSEEYYDTESCSEASIDGEGLQEGQFELHPELRQAFLEAKMFSLLIEKAKLPAENIVEALRQHPLGRGLMKRYETLQCRVFLCLSNLVTHFDVEEMGGGKELFDIWCSLAILAFQGQKSPQVFEAATACMRSIIRKLSQFQDGIIHLLKVDDVGILCQRVVECSLSQPKANLIQILGTLGGMAAGNEAPLNENRSLILRGIGQVLLDIACHESELWLTAEALDAIFDVFKEDHTDEVAAEVKLVDHLKGMATQFKHRVHAQRRSLPSDHMPVIMTAKDNLLRFIKYKSKRMAH